MTREQAIKHLEVIKGDCALVGDIRALDMAISALSENKGEWIPIKDIEDIPKSGEIWATIQIDDSEPCIELFTWSEKLKEWVFEEDGDPMPYHTMKAITAYMPYFEPKPYKAESEDKAE